MNNIYKFLVLGLMFGITDVKLHAYTDLYAVPPDIAPAIYDTHYDWNEISYQFYLGNYNYASTLVIDPTKEMYEYLKNEIKNNPNQYIHDALSLLLPALEKILNSTIKTEAEKQEETLEVITSDMGEYISGKVGASSVQLQFSLDSQASLISWDSSVKADVCNDVTVLSNGNLVTATRRYLKQLPDYRVYRIVNQEEELIAHIKGTYSIITDVYENLEVAEFLAIQWGAIDDERLDEVILSLPDDLAYYMDFMAGYYLQNTQVIYKIVLDYEAVSVSNCGVTDVVTNTIYLDENANNKVDFIPDEAYEEFEREVFIKSGALVPILNLML
jgi:hypothetical protein